MQKVPPRNTVTYSGTGHYTLVMFRGTTRIETCLLLPFEQKRLHSFKTRNVCLTDTPTHSADS